MKGQKYQLRRKLVYCITFNNLAQALAYLSEGLHAELFKQGYSPKGLKVSITQLEPYPDYMVSVWAYKREVI